MNYTKYKYRIFQPQLDEYGTPILNDAEQEVKMQIIVLNKQNAENPLFSSATLLGLTHDKNINENCIIYKDGKPLQVLYVIEAGRFRQVFMQAEG